MKKEAVISNCGNYRYSLTRIWDDSKPKIMFVMLNPSTADADNDDRTISKCIRYASNWGYGGLFVCNLFAYRSADPYELLNVNDPFGENNMMHIKQLIDKVSIVVCAWGHIKIIKKLLAEQNPYIMFDFCNEKLHYLELSIHETPKHPLYLNRELKPRILNI